MVTEIEARILAAKKEVDTAMQQREVYAAKIFNGTKIKKNANPMAKKYYYRYHDIYMEKQKILAKVCAEKKIESTLAKLEQFNVKVGEVYFYPRTSTTGTLMIDEYGYMCLHPIGVPQTEFYKRVSVFEHSVMELRKVELNGVA